MNSQRSLLLDAIMQAAVAGTDLSPETMTAITADELQALQAYIGTVEAHAPEGYLSDMDTRSPEWANAITEYRQRFEAIIFEIAVQKEEAGVNFLEGVVFGEPDSGVDYTQWEYARRHGIVYLTHAVHGSKSGKERLSDLLTKIEQLPALSKALVSGFIRGLVGFEDRVDEALATRLAAQAQEASEIGHGDIDFEFAEVFGQRYPALAAPLIEAKIARLGDEPIAALRLEELNYLLGLQKLAPGHEFLGACLALTADTWLTNPYFADGLYLFVAIWKHPDYRQFLQRLAQHQAALQRITRGLAPEPTLEAQEVDEVAQLRAHMLLYKFAEDKAPHRAFIEAMAQSCTAQEQVYLSEWLSVPSLV